MNRHIAMALVVAGCSLAGCGSGDESDSFKLVSATGTVTHNGKPLDGALVVFTPEPGNKPSTPGRGETGSDGRYTVAFRGRSGVAPGKYLVSVTKATNPAGAGGAENDPYMATVATQSKGPAEKNAAKAGNIEGQFPADVGASGGEFNFTVPAPGK
jgi:hypothetical protein